MSKTKRPKRDGELDQYFTRDDVARACVKMLPIQPGELVLEPHAGGGAFTRALRAEHPEAIVFANDKDFGQVGSWGVPPGHITRCDFLEMQSDPVNYCYHWIVGNPPYNEAEAHIRKALQLAPNVACLLRAGFLAPANRAALRAEFPLVEFHLLSPRPSFSADNKTDGSEYALHVWRQDWRRRHPNHERTFSVIEWRRQ